MRPCLCDRAASFVGSLSSFDVLCADLFHWLPWTDYFAFCPCQLPAASPGTVASFRACFLNSASLTFKKLLAHSHIPFHTANKRGGCGIKADGHVMAAL